MANIIITKTQEGLLTLEEIGMLAVVKESAAKGIFFETAESISARVDCHPRSIQRYLRRLVDKGLVIEVEPRHHDGNGYWVPATYGLPATKSAVGPATKSAVGPKVEKTDPQVLCNLESPATNVVLEADVISAIGVSVSYQDKTIVSNQCKGAPATKSAVGSPTLPEGILSEDEVMKQLAERRARKQATVTVTRYSPDDKIKSSAFDEKLLPSCSICHKAKVDFYEDEDDAVVELLGACDNDGCKSAYSAIKRSKAIQERYKAKSAEQVQQEREASEFDEAERLETTGAFA